MAFAAPLALIGAGLSAGGTVLGGIATGNAASYAAQVARNNATIANQNAEYAIAAGQAKAEATSRKGAATIGKIRAGQAASGIDVNTGSAVDVQVGQRETEKLDTETVLNNAQLQSYGYRTQATGFEAQAALDQQQADYAPIGAAIGATGSLLSNASSLGFKWSGSSSNASGTGSVES